MSHSSHQSSSDNKDKAKGRKILKLFDTDRTYSQNTKSEMVETEDATKAERSGQ